MNNKRRKERDEIVKKLTEVKNDVINLKEDEQEALENVPENLRESEACQTMEDAVEGLSDATYSIAEAIETLKNI